MIRLNDTDARAVDVLLDQAVSGGVTQGFALSARDMAGVSRTLELLSQMPAIDPPAGLVDRVLRAIDGNGMPCIASEYAPGPAASFGQAGSAAVTLHYRDAD